MIEPPSSSPTPQKMEKKSRRGEGKINKVKKSKVNYLIAVYKWVKIYTFSRG